MALSTAEAEYVAAAMCTAELIYLNGLCSEFCESVAVLNMDNTSAIKMLHNYENTKRSKHIDIKVHFIRDIVTKNLVRVKYVQSDHNVADIMTKPLGSVKFNYFRNNMLA